MSISAFVGHSFNDQDEIINRKFLEFFNSLKSIHPSFTWEHAQRAEPKVLAEKVREKMQDKNVFIGICTRKEYVINKKDVEECFLANKIKIRKDKLIWKTSDWIIQEAAYSFGQGKTIILLIEEGVRSPDVFQSNIEYIPFTRDNPEGAFNRLIQMIGSLNIQKRLPATLSIPQADSEIETPIQENDASENIEDLSPNANWTQIDYHRKLHIALILEKNVESKTIFDTYREKNHGNLDEIINWESKYFFLKFRLHKENTLENLKEILLKNPNNPILNYYIGKIYNYYGDSSSAIDYIKKSIDNFVDMKEKFEKLCELSLMMCEENNLDLNETLSKIIDMANKVEDGQTGLLNTLAKIFQIKKSDDNYLAAMEMLLKLNPDMPHERFTLAYKYSTLGENGEALYHYKKIEEYSSPDDAVYNNSAVAQTALGLPSAAISSYRTSEKLGSILAVKNIANKLLDSGFIEEAQNLSKASLNKKGAAAELSSVFARIEEIKSNENKKEQEILEKTKNKRNFYINYMQNYMQNAIDYGKLKGLWEHNGVNFEIKINGTQFNAKGKRAIIPGVLGVYFAKRDLKESYVLIEYSGLIHGLTIECEKSQKNEDELESLSKFSSIQSKSLMIISNNFDQIDIYEKIFNGLDLFYVLKKIS